jgi:hypothetical protein
VYGYLNRVCFTSVTTEEPVNIVSKSLPVGLGAGDRKSRGVTSKGLLFIGELTADVVGGPIHHLIQDIVERILREGYMRQ